LGNGYLKAAQLPAAIQSYKDSLSAANRVTAGPQAIRLTALARTNLCTAFLLRNQIREALPECQDGLNVLDQLESNPEINRLRIQTRLRYGSALRKLGQVAESNLVYKTAVSEVDAHDVSSGFVVAEMVEHFRKLEGGKEAGLLLASSLRKHGVVQARLGKRDQSLETFEQAMRIEAIGDPAMKDVVAYGEAALLLAEGQSLKQKSQVQQAIEASKKALNRIGESTSGSTSLLREEIEASLRSLETSLVKPPQ
jgi:tetratricopeptide (TPR) repeat protein